MRVLSLALLVTLSASCIASADEPKLPKWVTDSGLTWQPPPEGVVRDASAAIAIAHAIWLSNFPNHEDQIGDEAKWQQDFVARLTGEVWEVTCKDDNKKGPGGALFFYISKRDARILGIFLTQ